MAQVSVLSRAIPPAQDYSITPVPLTSVEVDDRFWAPKRDINRTVTIPHIMSENELTGRVDNFLKAAHKEPGSYKGQRYNDTDVYKVIEAASWSLASHPDPALAKKIDDLIAIIAAAQAPDGYLYTPREVDPEHPADGAGPERWSWLNTSHELYDQGHMIEAAVAHYSATGQRNFLDVAINSADLICRTFGPEGIHDFPGHEEIEIALVKLYRVTGDRKYLDEAAFFINERGQADAVQHTLFPQGSRFFMYNDPVYRQAEEPVVDQTTAVGHAVRATYLYSAMTDLTALVKDHFGPTLDALFADVTDRKMYVTGGLGANGRTEAFGDPYFLPNKAYAETCASVGGILWYHRMFLRDGNADHYDALERTLYNGYLSGVSLAGDTFFYQNPLVSDGRVERSAYFDVACCPANLARLMAEMPGLIYAQDARRVYVNLYVGSKTHLTIGHDPAVITQDTEYPWDGKVTLRFDLERPAETTLALRIPQWARAPSDPDPLYRFSDTAVDPIVVTLNGHKTSGTMQGGYLEITRKWRRGDVVTLDLPMRVRRVLANDKVTEDRGKAAIQRGPIVYALEGLDNGGSLKDLTLPLATPLKAEFRPNLLNGVFVVTGTVGNRTVTAVPYYAWNNRGKGEMEVWVPYQ